MSLNWSEAYVVESLAVFQNPIMLVASLLFFYALYKGVLKLMKEVTNLSSPAPGQCSLS